MYIWILLATIMVALTFFNLSPRADKDYALNEIKAATVVNRFRIEHKAMIKTIECEIMKDANTSNWDANRKSATGPVTLTHSLSLPYTKFKCHLPVGYTENSDVVNSHHQVFCLKYPVSENHSDNTYVACDKTDTHYSRYLVSYAPVPDRWVSKTDTGKPLPLFASFLSKQTSSGTVYGWTDCDDDGCVLRGLSSYGGKLVFKDATGDQGTYKKQYFEHLLLGKDAMFWKSSDFQSTCKTRPCLFTYEVPAVAETAYHCTNLMASTTSECN